MNTRTAEEARENGMTCPMGRVQVWCCWHLWHWWEKLTPCPVRERVEGYRQYQPLTSRKMYRWRMGRWCFHPSLDQHHPWQRPSRLLNFSVVPTGCQPPVPRGMPATCGSPFRRPMPRHTGLAVIYSPPQILPDSKQTARIPPGVLPNPSGVLASPSGVQASLTKSYQNLTKSKQNPTKSKWNPTKSKQILIKV
jgi:hypothetical protein